LFWRLDKRNARLVKVSEEALKKLEARMATDTHETSIRLIEKAHKKVAGFLFSKIESYSQIYGVVFAVSGLVGLAMAILSVRGWESTSCVYFGQARTRGLNMPIEVKKQIRVPHW